MFQTESSGGYKYANNLLICSKKRAWGEATKQVKKYVAEPTRCFFILFLEIPLHVVNSYSIHPSVRIVALGLTHPPTEMSTRNISSG